jgi:hypothetical protein
MVADPPNDAWLRFYLRRHCLALASSREEAENEAHGGVRIGYIIGSGAG